MLETRRLVLPFKLLIADDEPAISEVVADSVRTAWHDCEIRAVETGADVLDVFYKENFDLVILDIHMPILDGFEVCRRIRESSIIPILMLSGSDSATHKIRALNLGADDYVTKPFDQLELLARVRALLRRYRGTFTHDGPSFVSGDLTIDFTSRKVMLAGEIVHLTSTEYRLLEILARHAGIVVTQEILMRTIWGHEFVDDIHYLKGFVHRLRQKLGDTTKPPRYIKTEWGIGYGFIAGLETHHNGQV